MKVWQIDTMKDWKIDYLAHKFADFAIIRTPYHEIKVELIPDLGIPSGAKMWAKKTNEMAAVIVAAPELLEACKALVRVTSHIKDSPLADPLKYVPVSAYKEAYAKGKLAIEKAEGRS